MIIERLRQLARRARALAQHAERDDDMTEEMRFHIEMEARDLERQGVPRDAALRRARLAFGGVERHKEDGRDARGTRLAADLIADLHYAARQLRSSPGFAAATLLTLALGIGLSTAMFSIISAALMHPLPFDEPDRLVFVRQYSPKECVNCEFTAAGNYFDLRDGTHTLSGLSMLAEWSPVLRGTTRSDVLRGSSVTPDLFRAFRIAPLLGRTLAPDDTAADRRNVVVLNETLWRTRFAGDSTVVGRTLVLDGQPRTIVGVIPAARAFPAWSQAWIPLALNSYERSERRQTNYLLFARLADGATHASANAELAGIGRAAARAFPVEMRGWSFDVTPLAEWRTGGHGDLLLFGAAVALVMLIACINLAGLFVARLSARSREIAVRAAMGAGSGRIARQLFTETMLLAILGGALGLIVASLTLALIRGALPPSMAEATPSALRVRLDWRALAFALAAGSLTGFVIGLWPALRFARIDASSALNASTRAATSSGASARFRRVLVVAQISLAVVLLSVAGLLARSLGNLYAAPRGFQADGLLTVRVQMPRLFEAKADPDVFDRLVGELKRVPGVEDAAGTIALPLSFAYRATAVAVKRPAVANAASPPFLRTQSVTPDYFSVLGIPIVLGRAFTDDDRETSPPVVIVNEAFAEKFLSGENPIGRELVIDDRSWEIVGVNRNVYYMRWNKRAEPELYRPMRQQPVRWGQIALKTRGDPLRLAAPVAAAIRRVEPDLGIQRMATMRELLSDALASDRLMFATIGGFALAALLIAAIGLYAVISYAAVQRTREFGVRLALGADARSILRLVLADGARVAIAGAVSGIILSGGAARLLRNQLFGVQAGDPVVLAAVVAGTVVLALAASLMPARRAAGVDPMTSLRAD